MLFYFFSSLSEFLVLKLCNFLNFDYSISLKTARIECYFVMKDKKIFYLHFIFFFNCVESHNIFFYDMNLKKKSYSPQILML